jgi:hypothetical protein
MTVTTQYTTCTRTQTQLTEGHEAFDIRDLKGRVVGYRWSISAVEDTLTPDAKGGYCHYNSMPLNFFRVWGSPTRDGKNFVPGFNTHDVSTLEQAEAVVFQRIHAARKRDAKKFA